MMNLQKTKKKQCSFNLKDYTEIIETVAKVEYKKLSSTFIIDFQEILNIASQTIHSLSKFSGFEYYNTSYISTAIKWAIRNEVRRRYKWYSSKNSSQKGLPNEPQTDPELLKEAMYTTIMSIDEVCSEESNQPIQLKDSNYTPDEYVEFIELKKILVKALDILPQRERELVDAKFFKEKKLTELTEEFGISPSRITRIIQSALTKLKTELERQNMQ